jgi:hypothetical protein
MAIFRSNGNPNPIPDKNSSGVSVNIRLSETLLAVLLGSSVSFFSGIAVANNQSQNTNQICSLAQPNTTSVTPAPMHPPRKD